MGIMGPTGFCIPAQYCVLVLLWDCYMVKEVSLVSKSGLLLLKNNLKLLAGT
jgi:hypothetical protein